MSKKKHKPAKKEKRDRPGRIGSGTLLTVAVSAAIVHFLLTGWTAGLVSLVLPSLFVGVAVALILRKVRESAVVAGVAGLAASLVSAYAYRARIVGRAIEAMPRYAKYDAPETLYIDVVKPHFASGLFAAGGTWMWVGIAVAVVGTALVAGLAAWALRRAGDRARTVVAWVLVVLLVAGYVYSTAAMDKPFTSLVRNEPPAGYYAVDHGIYLKTYYNMMRGENYYDAILHAAAGDKRLIEQKAVVDGKFMGWAWAPWLIRRPTAFYLWRYLAPGTGASVVWLAIVLSAAVMPAAFWGLRPHLGDRAVLATAFILPYLVFSTISWNVFLPDYWAMLLLAFTLAALMRGQWVAAAGLMLVTALTRETIGPLLAVMALGCLFLWWRKGRDRVWLIRAGVFVAGFVLYLVAEQVHAAAGAPYVGATGQMTMVQFMLSRAKAPFESKILSGVSYLMFPYGFFAISGLVPWLLAPVGSWVALRGEPDRRLALTGLLVFWIAFMVVFGASSSYWGQLVMLPSLLWFGAGIATADEGFAYALAGARASAKKRKLKKLSRSR